MHIILKRGFFNSVVSKMETTANEMVYKIF